MNIKFVSGYDTVSMSKFILYSPISDHLYMNDLNINEQQIIFGSSDPPSVLKGYQRMLLRISNVLFELVQVVRLGVL